jgi:hypothetical protein
MDIGIGLKVIEVYAPAVARTLDEPVAMTIGGLTAAPATLTFVNALGNRDVGAVTSNQAGLTGTFTIAVPTPGVTSAKLFIEDAAGTVVS